MRLSSTFLCNYTSCTQHILVCLRLDVICATTTGKKSHGFRFTFIFSLLLLLLPPSTSSTIQSWLGFIGTNGILRITTKTIPFRRCRRQGKMNVWKISEKKVAKRIRIFRAPCVLCECDRIAMKTAMAKGYHIKLFLLRSQHIHTLALAQNSFIQFSHSFASGDVCFVRLNATQQKRWCESVTCFCGRRP